MQLLYLVSLSNMYMLIMVALCNRADHYVFALWYLSFFLLSFFFSSPNLSGRRLDVYHISTHGVALCEFRMNVWNVRHVALWKCRTQKIAILAPSHSFVGLYLRSWGMCRQSEKKLVKHDTSSTCPHNIVNFRLLTAEICWRVWGIPSNFNDFRILEALLHGTLVVDVSRTLRRWTEGATYIRQGDHHVGHWPTF